MSIVNIFPAIDLPVWVQLKSNLARNENGQRDRVDFPDEVEKQLREHQTGHFKAPNTVGAPDIMVMWRVPLILNEAGDGLEIVDTLQTLHPNKIEVFGVWNTDGTQFGLYPQHAALLSTMPNGVFEEIIKFAGDKDRIYT